MSNHQDSDYDEVYVVDDSDSNNGGEQASSGSGTGIIVSLLLVLFVPLALICLICSSIERGGGWSFGDTAIPLMAFVILSVLLSIMYITPPYEGSSNEEPQGIPSAMGIRKNKRKGARKNMLWYTLEKGMSEEEKNKANDDIELAIEALVKLGFGKRKAIEWVNRGVEDRIEPSNTQGLVVFALTRGARRKQGGLE
jgi:hypothetical protein